MHLLQHTTYHLQPTTYQKESLSLQQGLFQSLISPYFIPYDRRREQHLLLYLRLSLQHF